MDRQRIEYIDIAKGIAIFLMVLGHSYSENNGDFILKWIYSFHMPLFFITSGVLLSTDNAIKKFNLKKKAKSLMVPYLIWGSLYQVFVSLLKILGGEPAMATLKHQIIYVLKVTGSALWFLPTMFGVYAVFYLIYHLSENNKLLILVIALIGLILSSSFTGSNELLIVVLRIVVGVGFLSIGYCLNKLFSNEISKQVLLLLALVHFFTAYVSNTFSIATMSFGNPVEYVIISSLGTRVIYGWSQTIIANAVIGRLLLFWGRNSIKILCFHGFLIQAIRLIDYKMFNNILFKMEFMEGILLSLIVMALLTLLLQKKFTMIEMSFEKN